jgi:3-oxoacyl-[acyl-carrier protein] reductase
MDLGLRDRVYLVTGGSRGLGFAAAQALVADGARVLLSAPHEATASSAVARLAPDAAADVAAWVVADNADPATPGRLIAAARDRFGRLDGALISVGGSPPGTVAATTDEAWRSAFESVFLGAVRLARALAADLGGTGDGGAVGGSLTGAGGSIVFVLASSVRVPLAELAISNGLFPGLAGVVKTLAGELGPAGSGSTGYCPSGSPPTGSVNLMPCAAIPTRYGPGCPRTSRCAGTGSPRSSAGPRRSCCPRPRPTSRAR